MINKNLINFLLVFIFFAACANEIKPTKQVNTFKVDSTDIDIFKNIMRYAQTEKLSEKILPEITIAIAKYFLSTTYVGKTLEKGEKEQLIINLHELDCTTFVENVVSLSTCIKNKTTDFDSFCQTLIKFRYRNGKIEEYPSRLHYFTEWLYNNKEKKLISIVSNDFATDIFDPTVNFMSTHTKYYKQLKNEKFVNQIIEQEKEISRIKLFFVPKEKIQFIEEYVQNGDIIAITTTIKGLDITHVGIAYFVNNRLHLIHASSAKKKVVVSEKTLHEYLKGLSKNNGIIVSRLM